ncbi:MAG: hypothetical protein ACP6IQ_09090 [Candidatus Njordarchaeia archaeon]
MYNSSLKNEHLDIARKPSKKLKTSYMGLIDSLVSDLKHRMIQRKPKPICALTILGKNSVLFKLREIILKAKREIKLVTLDPSYLLSLRSILKAVRDRGITIDCLTPEYKSITAKELKGIINIYPIESQMIPRALTKIFERIMVHEKFLMAVNIDRDEVYFVFRSDIEKFKY